MDVRASLVRSAAVTAVAVCAAISGSILGQSTTVRGMGFGASTYSQLQESSGGEKVSSLGVWMSTSDWYACGGSYCYSVPQYASVTWSINDGYSTFAKAFGRHTNPNFCQAQSVSDTVNASPSNSYGTQYVYFPTNNCMVLADNWWEWAAGMCDTSESCAWFLSNGPQIGATLQPPSSSAFNFYYWW
jgi:hypothetical protein